MKKMKRIFIWVCCLMSICASAQKYEQLPLKQKLSDKDLSLAVTFDTYGVNADFAKGEKLSPVMRDTNLQLRMFVGFDGKQAYRPVPGENLKLPVLKNADFSKGTVILWYKAVDYVPGTLNTKGVKRGNIAFFHIVFGENPAWGLRPPDGQVYVNKTKGSRVVDLRLYEYADHIYFDYRASILRGPSRVQMSMKGIKQDEWCQIAVSWGNGKIAIYRNGELKMEDSFKINPKEIADFVAGSGFIGIKSRFYGDVHKYGVGIVSGVVCARG